MKNYKFIHPVPIRQLLPNPMKVNKDPYNILDKKTTKYSDDYLMNNDVPHVK